MNIFQKNGAALDVNSPIIIVPPKRDYRKTGKFFPFSRALFVGAAIAAGLLFLTARLPLCWDEGDTFVRADAAEHWARQAWKAKNQPESSLFSAKTLRNYFPNTVSREGHPAGYVVTVAAGHALGERWGLPPKIAYRLGPILLFAAALAAVFYRVERKISLSAAFFAVSAILLIPRVFVHAQIAFCDSVLMSAWLLAWAFFDAAAVSAVGAILFGVFLGLTLSAKFSGLLAAAAFGLFAAGAFLTGRKKAAVRTIFIGFPVAALTFYLLNPPIWHDPMGGALRFFYLNTHRSPYNIAVLFLGDQYNLDCSLPWWNTIYWTAVTVPAGLLAAALWGLLCGGLGAHRLGDWFEPLLGRFSARALLLLATLNAAVLLIARSLPGVPVHDGVRLFVAAFAFLGILAGVGLAELWRGRRKFSRLAALLLWSSALAVSVWYFPNGLSFYNILIGGLPGAVRSGMEATYYWDGLDRAAIDWLNANTDAHRAVLFGPASSANLRRYREWGDLTAEAMSVSQIQAFRTRENGEIPRFQWYVVQRRGGAFSETDRELFAGAAPVYVKTIRKSGVGPFDLSRTPLVEIYDYRDFLTAASAAKKRAAE